MSERNDAFGRMMRAWHDASFQPTTCAVCGKDGRSVVPYLEGLLDVRPPREAKCRHCDAPMSWLNERWYGLTAKQVHANQRAMYEPGHPPWTGRAPLWTIPADAPAPHPTAAVEPSEDREP